MDDKIPEKQPNKLLPFLRSLVETISNDGDIDKASADILNSTNLSEDQDAIQQLSSWIKVLQEYHVNPDVNQEEYLSILIGFGIPPASAKTALEILKESVPSEVEFELGRYNYVRAVILAQQKQLPLEKIRHFQELALRKYASDYRNFPGLQVLIREWEISPQEVKKILGQLLEESEKYATSADSTQYDGHTMQNLTLKQWIGNALDSLNIH